MAFDSILESRETISAADPRRNLTRPRLGALDLLLQLWRAKLLMTFVAILVFLPFFLFAMSMQTKYEASSGLLVSLGEELVYRPRVGSEAAGAIPEQELLNQAEIELLSSPVVADRVLDKFSIEAIYPEIAQERAFIAADAPGRDPLVRMRQMAASAILDDFSAGAAPKSNVIRATFKHEDAELSAAILNEMVDTYMRYRKEVFASSRATSFSEQRSRFEVGLIDAQEDIRFFLEQNRIGDFTAERQAAQRLYTSVSEQLFAISARETAVQGQLATLTRQMDSTQPLVEMFVEDSTDQTLLDLKIEREQALSRYKPDSRTVQAIDKRIEQVESYLGTQPSSVGTRRTGPNPIFQDMEQRRSGLEAEAQSLLNQRIELERQKQEATSRLRLFANLLPEWQELQRRRDLVERNLSSYAEREIESQTLSEIAQQESDNIRVIDRARVPLEGSSLKMPVIVFGFALALFTALIAGLLRATTRPSFSTAGSIERTTGIPVIASVRKR